MKSINLVAIIVIITKKCERLWLVFEGEASVLLLAETGFRDKNYLIY